MMTDWSPAVKFWSISALMFTEETDRRDPVNLVNAPLNQYKASTIIRPVLTVTETSLPVFGLRKIRRKRFHKTKEEIGVSLSFPRIFLEFPTLILDTGCRRLGCRGWRCDARADRSHTADSKARWRRWKCWVGTLWRGARGALRRHQSHSWG